MANYTRYSPADWSSSNMSHYNSADNARNNSERIRWETSLITSMLIYVKVRDVIHHLYPGTRPCA